MLDLAFLEKALAFIVPGVLTTLYLAFGVACMSLCGGALLALAMLSTGAWFTLPARALIAVLRATPEFVLMFWLYFCAPSVLGLHLGATSCGVVALSCVGTAYVALILCAVAEAIAPDQLEAALNLGFDSYGAWRYVLLPLVLRRALPALVSYATELVKSTSLVAALGATDRPSFAGHQAWPAEPRCTYEPPPPAR